MLDDTSATADKVLSALDGAWLAHIAAHGIFRADSPLFSSLRMHDGPLTVYDFERLNRAPYRLVLSSCDSGVLAPAGANELLGLVSSLLPLGTAGIVGAIVPLNDQAVVPLMVDLHRYLRAGQTLAESMYNVRRGLTDDPVQRATAASLVTLGRGLNPAAHSVIQPVSTSVPSVVWQRRRNGPAGMGTTEKHPISSTGVVVLTPALVWVSMVPPRGGMIWPSREPAVTSSSIDRWAEVKVSARIDAASDRTIAALSVSLCES